MKCKYILCVFLLLVLCLPNIYAWGQADERTELSEENRTCAKCHGNKYYSFLNPLTESEERKRMNPYLLIDTNHYATGVHRNFACTDCHSYDYNSYPHPEELKLEPKFSCIDCHGGDEKYQFDQIQEEVNKSVHSSAFGNHFKCEMCHDLHAYKPVARNQASKIKEIVAKDNQMCLSCHNDLSKYQILTDDNKAEILQTHSWLPNQELHFLSVRCIECHTPTSDTMMVSHKILPKEQAVKLCSDCHSTNSILKDKLYKYTVQQSRGDNGFYNAVIMNEAYVIGANRNRYFNILSLIVFGLTLGGISLHLIFRIIKKK